MPDIVPGKHCGIKSMHTIAKPSTASKLFRNYLCPKQCCARKLDVRQVLPLLCVFVPNIGHPPGVAEIRTHDQARSLVGACFCYQPVAHPMRKASLVMPYLQIHFDEGILIAPA
mmetsp:Transcript_35925/g.89391  ORF Transcript_35925/g.89391 Transcript_35925/m.89391 type:complete len:114 (-) Transcript_35925:937-1278(-)